ALAVAGLGVVGRDRYGVFPLRGKLRNVRELTVKQMLENKEIEQVLKIMALDASKDEYRDAKGLRYGSIMIMTDQDHDGSHIKGLIINFIQHWFPSLLRLPGFLKEFVTPIVKVQMPLHMISDKLDLKGPVNTLWLKELNAEEKDEIMGEGYGFCGATPDAKARAQAAQGFDSSFRRGAMEASMAELLVAHQKLESCLFSLGIRNVWDVRWFWRDGNDCLCELESCEGVSRSDIQVLYLTRVARANLAECFGAIHGGITLQFCEGCLLMEITCCREPSETSEDIDSLAAVITACAGCYAKCPPFQRKVCELFRLAVTHFLDLPALGLTPVHWDDELLNFRSRHYAGGKVYTTWLAKRRECEESLPLLPDEGVADAATLVDWIRSGQNVLWFVVCKVFGSDARRWAEAMSTVGLQQIIQDGLGMSSSMTSRSRHEPTERFEKLCLNLDSAYVWSWQATFSALVLPAFCVPSFVKTHRPASVEDFIHLVNSEKWEKDKAGLEALAFTKQVSLSTSEELELPIPESSLTGIWREFSKRTLSVIEVKRVKSRLAQPSASETVKLQDTSRGALSLSFALDPGPDGREARFFSRAVASKDKRGMLTGSAISSGILQISKSMSYSSRSRDDDLIDMAFAAKRSDDRKVWISSVEEGTFVDHSQPTLSYSDFIEKELSLFAKYDVERAVPSLVDGLKPGQRKVLYGSFKKKLTNEIKVAQLSGYVAETSAYHHGEASLQGTIIAMAQTFVGSNNINLFEPRGQFGSRLQGGKDHAAARYIFTCLCKVTRCLFPAEDDAVLEYLSEEGHQIEPRFYCPVIPLALVNGADGIGTGWSTSIPNHNPLVSRSE
ncbi:TOP2, partial [Symbiodinium sp. KB8]